MKERSEQTIVWLVLAAAGGVLTAPVVGRLGAARLADLVMGLAALSGFAAFAVAFGSTWRAARHESADEAQERNR